MVDDYTYGNSVSVSERNPIVVFSYKYLHISIFPNTFRGLCVHRFGGSCVALPTWPVSNPLRPIYVLPKLPRYYMLQTLGSRMQRPPARGRVALVAARVCSVGSWHCGGNWLPPDSQLISLLLAGCPDPECTRSGQL